MCLLGVNQCMKETGLLYKHIHCIPFFTERRITNRTRMDPRSGAKTKRITSPGNTVCTCSNCWTAKRTHQDWAWAGNHIPTPFVSHSFGRSYDSTDSTHIAIYMRWQWVWICFPEFHSLQFTRRTTGIGIGNGRICSVDRRHGNWIWIHRLNRRSDGRYRLATRSWLSRNDGIGVGIRQETHGSRYLIRLHEYEIIKMIVFRRYSSWRWDVAGIVKMKCRGNREDVTRLVITVMSSESWLLSITEVTCLCNSNSLPHNRSSPWHTNLTIPYRYHYSKTNTLQV